MRDFLFMVTMKLFFNIKTTCAAVVSSAAFDFIVNPVAGFSCGGVVFRF